MVYDISRVILVYQICIRPQFCVGGVSLKNVKAEQQGNNLMKPNLNMSFKAQNIQHNVSDSYTYIF